MCSALPSGMTGSPTRTRDRRLAQAQFFGQMRITHAYVGQTPSYKPLIEQAKSTLPKPYRLSPSALYRSTTSPTVTVWSCTTPKVPGGTPFSQRAGTGSALIAAPVSGDSN